MSWFMRKLSPPQILVVSFLSVITIGTLLLNLPIAASDGAGMSFVDSLFTATSGVCVTGLIVKDTGSFFSPFGKTVLFCLFQVGGLGIMTFSVLFSVLLGRKLTIKENLVIQSAMDQHKIINLKTLIMYIVSVTLGTELLGAALLFTRWSFTQDWSLGERAVNSLFHAVSAFCNAGFSLFSGNFKNFLNDPFINVIMYLLIFIGGIGFIVILDLPKLFKIKNTPLTRISMQSKLALTVSASLIIAGALAIYILESGNTLSALSSKGKFLGSFFQSITARTAGFNTLEIGKFMPGTLLFIIILMFIGASPGSTGGGIKTCTFGVLVATFAAMIRNKDRVYIFKRSVPKEVVRKSLGIFFIAITWIAAVTIVLSSIEAKNLGQLKDFPLKILFEVTSAFGTVGLSTGITPLLSTLGKLFIIVTMFVGRVGPLTLALAIAMQEEKILYTYPEERIMVG